jgi:hypothetical protein
MPEDSEKKDLKKHLNNEPQHTKKRKFREPQQLAKFILTQEPGYVWLDGAEIKRKFPDIYMSEKKINEYIATKEFKDAVYEYIPECTQAKASCMFDVLMYKYYKGQLDLPMPHQGALKIFGQISKRYDPTLKTEIYDGDRASKEREKLIDQERTNAVLNNIERAFKEGRVEIIDGKIIYKNKKEGEPDGN